MSRALVRGMWNPCLLRRAVRLDQERFDDRDICEIPGCISGESCQPYQKTLPMANPRPEIVVSLRQYSMQHGLASSRRPPCSGPAVGLTKRNTQVKDEVTAKYLCPTESAPSSLASSSLNPFRSADTGRRRPFESREVGVGTYANNWFDGHYVWLI